jgi:hypothetical protein
MDLGTRKRRSTQTRHTATTESRPEQDAAQVRASLNLSWSTVLLPPLTLPGRKPG